MMPSRGLPALKGRVSGVRQMQLRHLSSANARRWPSQSNRHALSLSPPTFRRSGCAAVLAAPTLITARHASSWWPWTTQSAPDATFRESHPPPSTPTEAPQAPSTPVDPPPASTAATDLPSPPAAATQASPEAISFPNLDTITLDNFDEAPIVEHMGYLKELGLDYGFGPTSIIQWTLELIHVNSGMPWWGSIATTAIVLRMLMFPLFMRSSDQMARSMAMQSVLKPLTERATAASRSGNQQEAMIAYQQVMAVRKRAGLSLFQQFLPMIFQTVFGYCGFKLMRAMAALPVPALVTDGPLWISDLTVSDPYLILPIIMAGSIHFLTRIGGESGAGTDTMAPGMKNVMLYVLPGFLLLCTGWLAAVVNVWFLAGGMFAVAQSIMLRRPAVRSFLGLTQFYRPTVDTTAQKEKKTVFEGVRQYLERKMGSGGARKGEAKYSYFAPGPNNSATIDTTATIRNSSEGVAGEAGEMPPAPASAAPEYTTKNYYQAPPPEPKKMSWQAPKINTAPRTPEASRPSYVTGSSSSSSVSNQAQEAYKTHRAAKAGKTEMPAAAASAAPPAKKSAAAKPSRPSKGLSKGGRR